MVGVEMLLAELARTSTDVAATGSRLAKRDALASSLEALRPGEVPVAVAYLSGELPHDSAEQQQVRALSEKHADAER